VCQYLIVYFTFLPRSSNLDSRTSFLFYFMMWNQIREKKRFGDENARFTQIGVYNRRLTTRGYIQTQFVVAIRVIMFSKFVNKFVENLVVWFCHQLSANQVEFASRYIAINILLEVSHASVDVLLYWFAQLQCIPIRLHGLLCSMPAMTLQSNSVCLC